MKQSRCHPIFLALLLHSFFYGFLLYIKEENKKERVQMQQQYKCNEILGSLCRQQGESRRIVRFLCLACEFGATEVDIMVAIQNIRRTKKRRITVSEGWVLLSIFYSYDSATEASADTILFLRIFILCRTWVLVVSVLWASLSLHLTW